MLPSKFLIISNAKDEGSKDTSDADADADADADTTEDSNAKVKSEDAASDTEDVDEEREGAFDATAVVPASGESKGTTDIGIDQDSKYVESKDGAKNSDTTNQIPSNLVWSSYLKN